VRVGVVVGDAADQIRSHAEGFAQERLGAGHLEDPLLGEGAELQVDGGGVLAPQRQDARLSAGSSLFRPYLRYISARQTETTGLVDTVEQATLGFDSHFAKYWGVSGSHTQAFSPQPGPRTSTVSFSYTDECLIFGVEASRNDNEERADISTGTSVVFHLMLKNFGGVKSDSFTGANFPAEFRQTE